MTKIMNDAEDTISREIGSVLSRFGISSKIGSSDNLEDAAISALTDALVKYGKSRTQINKISAVSTLLCSATGMGDKYCGVMCKASLLYDVGNLKIDPRIYEKDNKLTFEEFEIIKQHTVMGRDLLLTQKNPTLDMAAVISAQHHEWYDGSGYPYRLKGHDISLSARIVAVADTTVALYSVRKGRETMEFGEIVEHIKRRSGFHFDPEVVDRFLENKEKILEILAK
ncbi:MAG: HD domain-containing protein [Sulfurovum sp.]|nr:HD domain-containing protein [Sulfurovum sp.]